MNKLSNLKHITEQPFVVATGAAALIHSTWSLGTLFSGIQPDFDVQSVHFWGWLIPAMLMAFALDIGQISTSAEIREHGVNWTRGITFIAFAGATYYFQWFYMLHHMPDLSLAAGVTGKTWSEAAMFLRDAGIWIAPAMLPLSTILYTFSSKKIQPVVVEQKVGGGGNRYTTPFTRDGDHSSAYRGAKYRPQKRQKFCKQCGKELPQDARRNQRYCNYKCGTAYRVSRYRDRNRFESVTKEVM